jgi:hypothetical protein
VVAPPVKMEGAHEALANPALSKPPESGEKNMMKWLKRKFVLEYENVNFLQVTFWYVIPGILIGIFYCHRGYFSLLP